MAESIQSRLAAIENRLRLQHATCDLSQLSAEERQRLETIFAGTKRPNGSFDLSNVSSDELREAEKLLSRCK